MYWSPILLWSCDVDWVGHPTFARLPEPLSKGFLDRGLSSECYTWSCKSNCLQVGDRKEDEKKNRFTWKGVDVYVVVVDFLNTFVLEDPG